MNSLVSDVLVTSIEVIQIRSPFQDVLNQMEGSSETTAMEFFPSGKLPQSFSSFTAKDRISISCKNFFFCLTTKVVINRREKNSSNARTIFKKQK